MPACPQPVMDGFMRRLRAVNRTIDSGLSAKVFGKSSLQPLVALLKTATCTPLGIYRAIAALESASAVKYNDGLSFLLRSFPGLNGTGVQLDDLKKQPIVQTRAALYQSTLLPPNYQPADPEVREAKVFVTPPSAFLGGSIVEHLLGSPDDASILLIHLANADDAGLEVQFNGRTCLQYITSAVRVGRMMGCPVGVLSIGNPANPPLCDVLMTEYRLVPQLRRTHVHDDRLHTAGHRAEMQAFLRQRPRVVVMGFDGTVCVFANVFGSWDPAGVRVRGRDYRPPLINFADIIMSRATLASRGILHVNSTQTGGQAEYGPLWHLGPN